MTSVECAPWPNYTDYESQLVQEVLLSNAVNYWTGRRGREFESAFAKKMHCEHAIALANGTLALELALNALEIGSGDEVIVTPRSFVASASAIQVSGAKPVFADVDMVSQNITADSIESVLSDKTRAVVCVHLAGWPCDMEPIKELAERKGLAIIEDCAQAHGAMYQDRSVGSWGDVAAWSFCQDKIITTGGEGGMITTNDSQLYNKMWSFKDHGKNRAKMESSPNTKSFRYVHDSFGSNYRLTEMQSALGLHQLDRLDDWIGERSTNALRYHRELSKMRVVRSELPSNKFVHAYYRFYFFLNTELLADGWTRDKIVEEVSVRGGDCFSGSCPEIYREKAFLDCYGVHERLPNAAKLGEQSLMLTCHPGLSSEYLSSNIAILQQVLQSATSE